MNIMQKTIGICAVGTMISLIPIYRGAYSEMEAFANRNQTLTEVNSKLQIENFTLRNRNLQLRDEVLNQVVYPLISSESKRDIRFDSVKRLYPLKTRSVSEGIELNQEKDWVYFKL
jgi:hypothetical protein